MPVKSTREFDSNSSLLGVIGGTGLTHLPGLEIVDTKDATTEFGVPSAGLLFGEYYGRDVVFLARHGSQHSIPPHEINYRANISALKTVGVKEVIAVAAVGGIHAAAKPGRIVLPDQLIDYTGGRESTFYDGGQNGVRHIDFSWPYSKALRTRLLQAASTSGIDVLEGAVYGCTNGPRLETAAEIMRMEQDGCDLVGMTGMPETVLAREAGFEYACCAVVANWAAGKSNGEITMEDIEKNMERGFADFEPLLRAFLNVNN